MNWIYVARRIFISIESHQKIKIRTIKKNFHSNVSDILYSYFLCVPFNISGDSLRLYIQKQVGFNLDEEHDNDEEKLKESYITICFILVSSEQKTKRKWLLKVTLPS